jgi:rod shape-determining protein MreC
VFARKKRLITYLSIAVLIVSVSIIIPSLRNYLIDGLRWPLEVFFYINREAQGIIFYHQNLVQNQRLAKELGLVRRQLHEAEELYLENIRLRNLLEFKEKSVYPLTAARVIGWDPSNLSSIIIIDKGRKQGIEKNFAVITNDGLVGRIVEVGNHTSKVLLINDINSGVAALLGRSRQMCLVSGTLARGLSLHYLPPDADIEISDLVITSGLSDLYPKGIIIGRVREIQKDEGTGEIFAVLESSAKLSQLEEVLIVIE